MAGMAHDTERASCGGWQAVQVPDTTGSVAMGVGEQHPVRQRQSSELVLDVPGDVDQQAAIVEFQVQRALPPAAPVPRNLSRGPVAVMVRLPGASIAVLAGRVRVGSLGARAGPEVSVVAGARP
jgi:hypothetical protein